jgi:hypothetical protein
MVHRMLWCTIIVERKGSTETSAPGYPSSPWIAFHHARSIATSESCYTHHRLHIKARGNSESQTQEWWNLGFGFQHSSAFIPELDTLCPTCTLEVHNMPATFVAVYLVHQCIVWSWDLVARRYVNEYCTYKLKHIISIQHVLSYSIMFLFVYCKEGATINNRDGLGYNNMNRLHKQNNNRWYRGQRMYPLFFNMCGGTGTKAYPKKHIMK